MTSNHYTYRAEWSPDDGEFVGLVAEFPSLSWLAPTAGEAVAGIQGVVDDTLADMAETGEIPPKPLSERRYSGNLSVRMSPDLHRRLAVEAAEQGVSLNQWCLQKLAAPRSAALPIAIGGDEESRAWLLVVKDQLREQTRSSVGVVGKAIADTGRMVPDIAHLIPEAARDVQSIITSLVEKGFPMAPGDGEGHPTAIVVYKKDDVDGPGAVFFGGLPSDRGAII